ncbi:polyisoprenoid-binding protein [Marivirga tractuosa]|uniref:YceI family protein n=1 Tax=Marivirga tractuosa (strain ATCC 23168 / DSM 4126 / NBRC 15989 / NCIMB 1408 / VKM B-1430 / H-43) TaxID=643867 RepID=E4TS06_MARTH|nr:YceI family protein [Marivirga tractuosa]ADR20757.1 YceI family protein [Marivirga tractuosa DSM 4126]BDD14792.1 polyisoprenoid-binding protein [Marivirga tractuosa]
MKILKTTSALAFAIILAVACTSNPKSDEAKVSEAEEVTEAQGMEINVSSDEAEMEFVGTKPTGRHYGNIALSDGSIKVKDGKITGGKFVFDLNQITITDLKDDQENHKKLVGHLQSDDFFDAKNHPKVTFELVSVKALKTTKSADSYDSYQDDMEQPAEDEKIMELPKYELEGATHEVTGNLTMRGKTLAITVPAKIEVADNGVKAFTNFSIDRTKWGLMYGDESKAVDKAKDKFIYNTVGIGFNIDAKAKNM